MDKRSLRGGAGRKVCPAREVRRIKQWNYFQCKIILVFINVITFMCMFNLNKSMQYSKGTTDSQQLHKEVQITAALAMKWVLVPSSHIMELIGRIDWKIVYFCLRTPMTRSTCMQTQESWRALSTLTVDCLLPLVNGGNLISAQLNLTLYCTLNPQSA